MKKTNLFATPKRAALTCLGVAAMLAVAGTGGVFAAGVVAESNSIGKDAANSIALADAGVLPENAVIKKTEFDYEKGKFLYEVEFYADGVEYEYKLNAEDGSIVKKETEKSDAPNVDFNSELITLEKAKEIAINDAGIADVTFTETDLDEDDGRYVYELEFVTADKKYEYKINAKSGNIVKKEVENRKSNSTTENPPAADATEISLDEAKAIALADAGLNANDVTFIKEKLDCDDGVNEYDIEFYNADKTVKYEYEIIAATGKIKDKEIENIFENKPVENPTVNENPPADENPSADVPSADNTQDAIQYIGIAKAKEIALNHAGLTANEVIFEKVEKDREDGEYVYEIEFRVGRYEYEYEIHAVTGKILDYEKDIDD